MLVVYSLAGISALSHVVPMYRLVAGRSGLVTRPCLPRRENRRKPAILKPHRPPQGHSGRGAAARL